MLTRRLRRLATLAAALGLCAGTRTQAQDQSQPALVFPASLETEPLTDWMKRETDLTPPAVVAVTPAALTGILTSMSTPEGLSRRLVILRSEALSADGVARNHAASWTSTVMLDCKTRKVRPGRTMAYAQRNLMGEGRETKAAETAWTDPPAKSAVAVAMLRICDGETVGPLTTPAPVQTAAKAEPPPRPALSPKPGPKPAPRTEAKASPPLRPAVSPVKPAAAGTGMVQVGASTVEAEARRFLAAAKGRVGEIPAGVSTRVVKALVGGKTLYRAQFTGFGSLSEATGFCRTLAAKGQPCFARAKTGG
jgi:hypothetical protein